MKLKCLVCSSKKNVSPHYGCKQVCFGCKVFFAKCLKYDRIKISSCNNSTRCITEYCNDCRLKNCIDAGMSKHNFQEKPGRCIKSRGTIDREELTDQYIKDFQEVSMNMTLEVINVDESMHLNTMEDDFSLHIVQQKCSTPRSTTSSSLPEVIRMSMSTPTRHLSPNEILQEFSYDQHILPMNMTLEGRNDDEGMQLNTMEDDFSSQILEQTCSTPRPATSSSSPEVIRMSMPTPPRHCSRNGICPQELCEDKHAMEPHLVWMNKKRKKKVGVDGVVPCMAIWFDRENNILYHMGLPFRKDPNSDKWICKAQRCQQKLKLKKLRSFFWHNIKGHKKKEALT